MKLKGESDNFANWSSAEVLKQEIQHIEANHKCFPLIEWLENSYNRLQNAYEWPSDWNWMFDENHTHEVTVLEC